MNRHHSRKAIAIALATLAVPLSAARAGDTEAENRELKERVKQLETMVNKLAKQQQEMQSQYKGTAKASGKAAPKDLEAQVAKLTEQQKQTAAQVRGIAKSPKMPADEYPVVCKDQACPPPPPPVFVSFTNGLKVESYNGDFSFKIGGRVIVDGGTNTGPFQGLGANSPYWPAQKAVGYSNQVGIRQFLVQFDGTAFKYWDYRMQYEFNGAGNGLTVGGVRDGYIALHGMVPVTFQVGSMLEPFQLTRSDSSLYQTFIERALPETLTPGYHLGLAAETGAAPSGIAPPGYGKPDWSFKTGLYSTSVDQGCTSCAGAPSSGSSSFLGPVAGGHQFWDVAARLTYAPVLTEDRLLHFGGSVRYEDPNDSTAYANNRVLQPGTGVKSEANILNQGMLGTQPLTCVNGGSLSPSTQSTQLVGQNCVKSVLNYGFEAIAAIGPVEVQAEYIAMHYDRNAAEIIQTGSPGGATLNFSGYYGYATLFLTGESRAASYRTSDDYNAPGTFGQIKINNPLSAGGWGAWEVAARFSEINLNSGGYLTLQPNVSGTNYAPASAIQGGRQSDVTLGLNWYPDRGFRFMFNYVNVVQLAAPYDRPNLNGAHPQLFEVRAQANW